MPTGPKNKIDAQGRIDNRKQQVRPKGQSSMFTHDFAGNVKLAPKRAAPKPAAPKPAAGSRARKPKVGG